MWARVEKVWGRWAGTISFIKRARHEAFSIWSYHIQYMSREERNLDWNWAYSPAGPVSASCAARSGIGACRDDLVV